MTRQGFMDRLHRRRAEGVWRRALQDVRDNRLDRRDATSLFGYGLAVCILLVPPAFGLAGLTIIWLAWPSVIGGLLGLLLIGACALMWPYPAKLPDRVQRRTGMPETFALLDRICAALNAPEVSGVIVDDDFNARMMQPRGEAIVGLGAVLWQVAAPEQRIALLAHELGHLVNGDPVRGQIIGNAFHVLDRWHGIVDPSGGNADSLAAELIQAPITLAIELTELLLRRATYADSQRAEYLADALAARVAGPEAMRGLLNLLLLTPGFEARLGAFYGPSTPKGVAWFQTVAEALRNTPQDRWDALRIAAEKEGHTVDQSHPPTIYRLYFIEELTPSGGIGHVDWGLIEAEWTSHLQRLGDVWYARFQVQ